MHKSKILLISIISFLLGFCFSKSYSQPSSGKSSFFSSLYQKQELESILSFGNSGCDSTIIFKPTELIISLVGEIYVLDSDDKRIKCYNPQGKYIGCFGGYGQGPGEIMSSICMKMSPGGEIIIYDYRSNRFVFYTNERNFSYFRTDKPFRRHRGIIEKFFILTDTTMLIETEVSERISSKGHDFNSSTLTERSSMVYLDILNLSTLELTTIDSCEIQSKFVIGSSLAAKPFPSDFFWGVQPDGRVVTINSDEEFGEIYDQNQKKIIQFPLDIKRTPVTAKDLKSFFDLDWIQKFGARRLRRELTLAKYKPVCEALFIDECGYIMLRGRMVNKNTCEYHVYSPQGDKIGKFRMQYLSADAKFWNGFVYDLIRPDDDYASVVKYIVK